jgi:hypothetical protein
MRNPYLSLDLESKTKRSLLGQWRRLWDNIKIKHKKNKSGKVWNGLVYTPLIYEAFPFSLVKNKKLHFGEGPFPVLRLKQV